MTTNAFLITDTTADPVAHPLTLEAFQASVGGYICPAFTVDGPDGHAITGYVNDEGLLIDLPLTLVTDRGGYFAGPVIIAGLDAGGETVPLTPTDMDWIEERLTYVMMIDPNHEGFYTCWRLTLEED